jgi:hypothetical protein
MKCPEFYHDSLLSLHLNVLSIWRAYILCVCVCVCVCVYLRLIFP